METIFFQCIFNRVWELVGLAKRQCKCKRVPISSYQIFEVAAQWDSRALGGVSWELNLLMGRFFTTILMALVRQVGVRFGQEKTAFKA